MRLATSKTGDVIPLFCLHSALCIHAPCFSYCNPWKSRRVRSSDSSGQFCGSLWSIHWSGNWSFRYSITCRLKCGVPHHVGSTAISCFVSFRSSLISIHSFVTVENQTHVHMTFLTGNDLKNKILKYWHVVTGHLV
jgi:hypothetical protein